jgi:hypothetical protein
MQQPGLKISDLLFIFQFKLSMLLFDTIRFVPERGSRAYEHYTDTQSNLKAKGWITVGSRNYLESPPKGHAAYQRYVDLQTEAESRDNAINPSSLSRKPLEPNVKA